MRKLLDVNVAAMLALGLALVVFFIDGATPLGYAVGVFHLVPLMLAMRTERPLFVFVVAGLSSILVILDVFLGAARSQHVDMEIVLGNKALTLVAIWIAAALATWRIQLENERKRTATEIMSSNEALWALIEASPLAIITLDGAGRVKMWNPAAAKIFGWQQTEVLDKPHPIVPPDMQDEFRWLQAQGLHGESFTGLEVVRSRRDGSLVTLSMSTALLRNAAGQVISILEILEDITERKQAEQERLDHREALLERQRHETQIVAEQLEKARRDLVRSTRLATVGQMSAQLAHDLRNPLGAVRNAAYYLERKVPPGEPKWTQYLALIQQEVETCDQIITNLLEVTRGKELTRRWIDLCALVHSAAARLDLPSAVQWQVVCDPQPFLIDVDPVQMRQLLDNLLKNAADAVGAEGNITVRAVRSADATLDTIIVEDTGPGIPEEHREFLFELFFTTKAKGTGLGLAICRQIVQRHGGTIVLNGDSSIPGAAFRIELPRRESVERDEG